MKQVESRIKESLQTLESHESSVSKEVAPIVTVELNNGSSRNSASKIFWSFLNQLLLWVTSASPNKQVGSRRIQERSPTLESPQDPISKEVAPIDTAASLQNLDSLSSSSTAFSRSLYATPSTSFCDLQTRDQEITTTTTTSQKEKLSTSELLSSASSVLESFKSVESLIKELDCSASSSQTVTETARLTPSPSQSFVPKALIKVSSSNETSYQTEGSIG